MMSRTAALRGRIVSGLTLVLMVLVSMPAATLASSHDDDLIAILDLPRGAVEVPLEIGSLQVFDEENVPFSLAVLDGCAVNGHLWVFGAGLSAVPAALEIIDERGGGGADLTLPAYEFGSAIPGVIDPEAIKRCAQTAVGGLPPVNGVATYTSASPRCPDFSDSVQLLANGSNTAYRSMIRGFDENRVIGSDPVVTIDDRGSWDELHLLAEGRTPRLVEGVVFSGPQGMLPRRAQLDRELKDITKSRVRRAFETAKAGRLPRGIIDDMGLRGVECVYHISLGMDSFGADAYLAQAGWIREGGVPLEPPALVPERFTVELVEADGTSTRLPLLGPVQGSEAAGMRWAYGNGTAAVHIMDACALGDAYWIAAGALTDKPLQLDITDSETGVTASSVLWTDIEDLSRLADTTVLAACAP